MLFFYVGSLNGCRCTGVLNFYLPCQNGYCMAPIQKKLLFPFDIPLILCRKTLYGKNSIFPLQLKPFQSRSETARPLVRAVL